MNLIPYLIKIRAARYHLAGWLVFIVYEILYITLIGALNTRISVWGGYVIPYIINITLFYFHAFLILDRRNRKNSLLLIPIFTIAEIAVYLILMMTNNWLFRGGQATFIDFLTAVEDRTYIQQLWRGFYFIIFSTSFWFIYNYFKNQRQLKEAETKALIGQKEKAIMEVRLISAQNAFLQSQINPHLLFNTLNFIHSEVQQASPKASQAVIILSDMMRYSLSEPKGDGKVPLDLETEQIENLISINQFRFNNKLHLQLTVDGIITSGHRIIPLLLVPFVENLFKYAELLDEKNPAQVYINVLPEKIYFETVNQKKKTKNFPSPGIGIDNVKKRLNAFYPGNFSLDIQDGESLFSVKLIIDL